MGTERLGWETLPIRGLNNDVAKRPSTVHVLTSTMTNLAKEQSFKYYFVTAQNSAEFGAFDHAYISS